MEGGNGSGNNVMFASASLTLEGIGGCETDPGIFINWSLRLGTTASRCITFNKFWPISRDLVFDIRILELWVVNEVVMKKRNIPKRDFYSTVVMWNRIGKHKAKEDCKRPDRRSCCFHDGINSIANDHCSHVEIHETDERHFEPSNPSLMGTNNIDDELLIAIKNRLAGVPPVLHGALSLKPEAELQRINQELPMTSTKPQYLANGQLSKPRKVPTQVSTQVDDGMITELKNQGTSTSHVKVTSRFTQSGTGLASQMEETAQLRHSSSRMQRADEGYQRSLPLEQNNRLYRSPSRTLQPNEQYQQPLQPRQNSFPNHMKRSLQSPSAPSPHANYPPSGGVIRNSVQSDHNSLGLPEVPEHYGLSSQRPSVSRSIRSSIDEATHTQQIHELSWSNRRNMGAILPYQQQLVRAAPNRGDLHNTHLKQSSNSKSILTEGSRDINRERSQAATVPHHDRTAPSRGDVDSYGEPFHDRDRPSPNRSIREVDPYTDHSQYEDRASPSRSTKEVDSYHGTSRHLDHTSPNRSLREGDTYTAPPYQDHAPPSRTEDPYRDPSPHRVRLDPAWDDSREAPPSMPPPPPEGQTVLAMPTQQAGSSQLCKCGSKELNLVCGCRKSILKEVEITNVEECLRECRCPRKYDSDEDGSKNKKKKKDKKGKLDKEAKAEEKRRKKEEKQREKRERAAQKAREKEERKKSKTKGEKKSKKKGDKNKDCKMCSCCKCCGDEEETIILPSESGQSEENSKKKSKKDKKPKAKKEKKQKEKKKKKTKERGNDPPFRSCQCTPVSQAELDNCCRLSAQAPAHQLPTSEEPAALRFCNHPDFPCPALGNGEINQVSLPSQSHKSVMLPASSGNYCGDPVCTNAKRNKQCGTPVTRNSNSDATKGFCSCCCARTSGGCRAYVCSYVANAAVVEQPNDLHPAQTKIRGNSPSAQPRTSQNSPHRSSMNADAMRYRDITAAPALIFPNEAGHGDTAEALPPSVRPPTDPRSTSLPSGFPTNGNLLIDLSRRGRENDTNKRYVPPCVLYLDCTKVKDLCVIIKDKYEEPS